LISEEVITPLLLALLAKIRPKKYRCRQTLAWLVWEFEAEVIKTTGKERNNSTDKNYVALEEFLQLKGFRPNVVWSSPKGDCQQEFFKTLFK